MDDDYVDDEKYNYQQVKIQRGILEWKQTLNTCCEMINLGYME